jgi:hypothetical protein
VRADLVEQHVTECRAVRGFSFEHDHGGVGLWIGIDQEHSVIAHRGANGQAQRRGRFPASALQIHHSEASQSF